LCEFSGTISVTDDGLSNPIAITKKPHSCSGGVITSTELINAKPEMAEIVKALAAENAATRAPSMIAADDVMKHFEEKYAEKAKTLIYVN
jgi:hypothetical protein